MADENKNLTPVWIAYVDGKRLSTDYEGALRKIYINDRLDFIGTASLLFDISAVDFDNDDIFVLGSEVSIHLGYKDDVEEVFVGEVTDFAPRFEEYNPPSFEVRIKTKLNKLKKGNKFKSFENKTPSDIIKDIVTKYDLTADVDDFGQELTYTEQHNLTDYDYITYLADKYGKFIYCYNNTVYVKTEISPTNDDVVLEWGKTLISARTEINLRNQLSAVTATGWDVMKCEGFTATATMKDVPLKIGGEYCWEDNSRGYDPHKVTQLNSADFTDEAEAMEIAKATILKTSLQFQTCEAKTEGNYHIRPGNRITIKYLGKESDGEYLVSSVEHTFNVQEGYFTTCHLKRNFCEISNRSGNVSSIDKERAENQTAHSESKVIFTGSGSQAENQGESENTTAVGNNTQTLAEENSQADNNNPIVADNNEEILYDFGKIATPYRDWKQQDDEWKNEKLSNAAGDTMEKHGCKVVSAARLVCTISKNNKFTPNRFTNKKDKIVDSNGDLSQSGIMSSIKKANPNIVVKSDYFEKHLNESTLKNLKKDSKYIHYILGRAYIGGGLGQHWVNIEDYTVLGNGVIEYKILPSSKNDAGRIFRSNSTFATDTKKAYINKIEVYSIERKGN